MISACLTTTITRKLHLLEPLIQHLNPALVVLLLLPVLPRLAAEMERA